MADSDPSASAPAPPRTGGGRKIDLVADKLDSRDLFVGTREITITHGEHSYRLRLTSQNKLILTK
ncbi:hemin uptake protein hemP [Variibacter gotjawalensis]|uniref:Hemin uptake protein hemP n=1 Tax=Variibacter gotjawalensis TaxID=1333996 RepID=A0A0S3PNI5_9BRAD|nr:hemin uptake protein HemP [Variibacter gotjawalensis]NIK47794.1 hemin uptake protein HemP [Variibacter gotjawalensis]RZS49681.1 hemin uptake protein HemP [Variibacter gotjawalensis]BAT57510.1 hemin uptake protein hemP [Variibacter gotjawalensis]